MIETRKPNNVVFNFEVIRDFCGSISKYEKSHLDDEIWTRNLLLLKHFPGALYKYCKEHEGDSNFCSDYSEWKNDLGHSDCLYDMDMKNVSDIIIKGASEELSFDEIASVNDALYVNGVPGEVESIAYDMIEGEMSKFGFNTKFAHFN
jgi:hypothetical protein